MNEKDECVWVWTPAALGRGPIALLGVPLMPARAEVFAYELGRRNGGEVQGVMSAVLLGPLAVPGFVVVPALYAMTETLTGGYFPVIDDKFEQVYWAPLLPPDAPVESRDGCGRVLPEPTRRVAESPEETEAVATPPRGGQEGNDLRE